jgi:glycerate-2-kinase
MNEDAGSDAYHALQAAGGHFKTGPTETNVGDIHILVVHA